MAVAVAATVTDRHMADRKRLRQDTDRKQTAVATEAAPVAVPVPALSAIVAVTTDFPATVAVAVYFPNKPQLTSSLKVQIRI